MDQGANNYKRFLAGSEDAFVDIVREYNDGLVLYLLQFVGSLSAADELAEDTFVKLGIKRPRFRGTASFKTWLYAIGRNLALDYQRRSLRENLVPLESHEELADREELEQRYLREEQKQTLHRAMQQLTPEYRQVLWLIYFEDFSHRETATIMKKSVHAVETLVYRARQSLKTKLDKEGFVYENL